MNKKLILIACISIHIFNMHGMEQPNNDDARAKAIVQSLNNELDAFIRIIIQEIKSVSGPFLFYKFWLAELSPIQYKNPQGKIYNFAAVMQEEDELELLAEMITEHAVNDPVRAESTLDMMIEQLYNHITFLTPAQARQAYQQHRPINSNGQQFDSTQEMLTIINFFNRIVVDYDNCTDLWEIYQTATNLKYVLNNVIEKARVNTSKPFLYQVIKIMQHYDDYAPHDLLEREEGEDLNVQEFRYMITLRKILNIEKYFPDYQLYLDKFK